MQLKMHLFSSHQLALVIFTALSLFSLVDAIPPGRAPADVIVEPRKPPQRAAPGCPTAKFLHRQAEYFLRTYYDPSIPKEYAEFGGYHGFTQDWYWDNFTVTDNTPNYPAEQKGKKRAPPGNWAKSRRQFSDKLNEVVPKIRSIFGDIKPNYEELYYGGLVDDNECLTGFWKAVYTAKLKKPYG